MKKRIIVMLLAAAVVSFGQAIKDVTRGASTGGGGSESTAVVNAGTGRAVLKLGSNVHARTLAEACGIAMVEGADEVSVARSAAVNAQTGTTYTVLTGDCGKLVTHSNASAIAVTLPQAGASFPAGWFVDVQNRGAGTVTITPTTSTLDGAANLVLTAGQGVRIFSDGTNYFTQRGSGGITGPSGQVLYFSAGGVPTSANSFAFNAGTGFLGLFGGITAGQPGTATGQFKINGITSGTVTVTSESAAGTYELRVPTLAANAYAGNYTSGTADPPATCVVGSRYIETDTNESYTCTSTNNWTLDTGAGGSGTIASSTNALRGDGAGNAIAVTGTASDCVKVDGSSGACSGGSSTVSGLTDLKVERTSATVLTVGANCSTSTPCLARIGNTQYTFADSQTITCSTCGASGTVWFGIDTAGNRTVWHNLTDANLTVSGGLTKSSGATGFPAGAVPIGTSTVVASNFEVTGIADARAMLSRERAAVAGSGITITNNANGQQTIAAADSVVQFTAGSGAPSNPCTTVGTRYIRTDNNTVYECPVAGNNWFLGAGGDTTTVANSGASGAAVLKTSTNVTARKLVAGSNVTVTENADDITIASSGGDTTTVSNSGASGASVLKTSTNVTARKLVAGSNVTVTENADDITIAATGGGLSDGDKGDITVGGSGTTLTIDNGVVTPAKTSLGTINSGGLPYFNSGTGWASSGALGAGDAIFGGGAGAAPVTSIGLTRINVSDRLTDVINTQTAGTNRLRVRSPLSANALAAALSFYDANSTAQDEFSVGLDNTTQTLRINRRTTNFFSATNTGFIGIGQTAPTPVSTLGISDRTATTGVTRVIIEAGAGQSTTNLTEWQAQNATHGSGTVLARITSNGTLDAPYNAENSLSVLTIPTKTPLPLVSCSGTTGTVIWNVLTTLAPTATCSAGTTETTMMRGVADFPDSDGDYSVQQDFPLPDDFTGAIDAKFFWRAAATTGDVVWQIQTACRADGEVDDVAWNTASTVTDTAKGTANQINTASITGVTATGCSAGEILHIRVLRNRTNASDTITGVVSLGHFELTTRRAI